MIGIHPSGGPHSMIRYVHGIRFEMGQLLQTRSPSGRAPHMVSLLDPQIGILNGIWNLLDDDILVLKKLRRIGVSGSNSVGALPIRSRAWISPLYRFLRRGYTRRLVLHRPRSAFRSKAQLASIGLKALHRWYRINQQRFPLQDSTRKERVFHARLAPSGFSYFCFLTKSAWLVLVLDRSLAFINTKTDPAQKGRSNLSFFFIPFAKKQNGCLLFFFFLGQGGEGQGASLGQTIYSLLITTGIYFIGNQDSFCSSPGYLYIFLFFVAGIKKIVFSSIRF